MVEGVEAECVVLDKDLEVAEETNVKGVHDSEVNTS